MFRTELHIPETNLNLTLQDKVVTIGSCFAEVIGSKLQDYKSDVMVNPFGTIFNPISVCRLLKSAAGDMFDVEQSLVQRDSIWYSYDLHSSISSPNKAELLQLIETRVQETSEYLKDAKLLIITLGTAMSYELAETKNIVANCHKLPSKQFSRTLLTIDEITENLETTWHLLKEQNPKLRIALTVSPVRHIKETLPTNNVSKSILRVAAHYLSERHSDIHYFPAYELMLDDLRDYRFYGQDMLHPTSVAEDYIWQKFSAAYLHQSYRQFIPAWEKIRKALTHRPFHAHTDAHQTFIRNTIAQIQQLSENYKIVIKEEEAALRKQLIAS